MLLLISFNVLSKSCKTKKGQTIHSSLGTLLQVFHEPFFFTTNKKNKEESAKCSNDDTQTKPSYINQY